MIIAVDLEISMNHQEPRADDIIDTIKNGKLVALVLLLIQSF